MPLLAPGTDKLTRITTSGRFIPEIDGLRFLAIAGVVLYHLYAWACSHRLVPFSGGTHAGLAEQLLRNGGTGVPLFFVISGFLIALPFASWYLGAAAKPDLKHYYLRRLTRIEPPYVLCMVLFCSVLVLSGQGSVSDLLPRLGAALLYANSIAYDGSMSIINEIIWSLEVEVQFYLAAPVLCACFALPCRIRRIMLVAAMIAAAWLQWQIKTFVFSPLFLLGDIQYFLAGFLLADVYLSGWFKGKKVEVCCDSIGFALIPLVFFLGWKSTLARFLLPYLILLLAISSLKGRLLRRLLTLPVLAITGGMCYSIYLVHLGIIKALGPQVNTLVPAGPPVLAFVVLVILLGIPILLLSTVYFVCVERPCMNPAWPRAISRILFDLRSRFFPPTPS